MKRRKRARGRRSLRRALAFLVALPVAAAVVLLAFSPLGQQLRGLATAGSTAAQTVAIVDQTGIYDSNPEFVAAATDLLEGAGYVVDYYRPEEVTVDFYRELPALGYDVIVLRAHSARLLKDGRGMPVDEVVLFTNELFDPLIYRDERKADQMAKVRYYEGGEAYFGIRASFVTSSMRGNFDGATVIAMGCNGLTSINETAIAFIRQGADSFTSWDDLISWGHSDAATERLLELLLVDELGIIEAAESTVAEVGADPYFGANLRVLVDGR